MLKTLDNFTDSFNSISSEAQKLYKQISKKKEGIVALLLEKFDTTIEKALGRKFPKLQKETMGSVEIYYYDDGSKNGIKLVSFESNPLKINQTDITATITTNIIVTKYIYKNETNTN